MTKIRESGMRGRSTSPGEEAQAGTSGKMSEAIKAKHGRGTLTQRCSAHPHIWCVSQTNFPRLDAFHHDISGSRILLALETTRISELALLAPCLLWLEVVTDWLWCRSSNGGLTQILPVFLVTGSGVSGLGRGGTARRLSRQKKLWDSDLIFTENHMLHLSRGPRLLTQRLWQTWNNILKGISYSKTSGDPDAGGPTDPKSLVGSSPLLFPFPFPCVFP